MTKINIQQFYKLVSSHTSIVPLNIVVTFNTLAEMKEVFAIIHKQLHVREVFPHWTYNETAFYRSNTKTLKFTIKSGRIWDNYYGNSLNYWNRHFNYDTYKLTKSPSILLSRF